uniref:Uncharacterized protein n=1 Tax=Arundo donax TaxID=35708 RepID=A0A0A9G9M1_ARUDO
MGVSPTAATSTGASPAARRCGALAAAMERFRSARSASWRACCSMDAPPSNARTRNGTAPDAPMSGLFASSALRQRKLATTASVSAPASAMRSILCTAPACTIAALFVSLPIPRLRSAYIAAAVTSSPPSPSSSIATSGGMAPSIASISLAPGSSLAFLRTAIAASTRDMHPPRSPPPPAWSAPTTTFSSSRASTFLAAASASASTSSPPHSDGSALSSSASRSDRGFGFGIRCGDRYAVRPRHEPPPSQPPPPHVRTSSTFLRSAAAEKIGQSRNPPASGCAHLATIAAVTPLRARSFCRKSHWPEAGDTWRGEALATGVERKPWRATVGAGFIRVEAASASGAETSGWDHVVSLTSCFLYE